MQGAFATGRLPRQRRQRKMQSGHYGDRLPLCTSGPIFSCHTLLTRTRQAKPVSKFAQDPDKVSHHIHRIGYHFKSEVLDEAREELGYIVYHGKFVKEIDLQKQSAESKMAQTLARYGIRPDTVSTPTQRETPQQVRSAIKELFPKMPDDDLEQIVSHAWEAGTHRVGTVKNLDLPRRVQLATIARIRHTYTDYDRLLRAFEWKDARLEVEQDCIKKLLEWRGEGLDELQDEGLEDVVRETIVIDDDDDDAGLGDASEADDEDSMTEAEPGDTSDASIEFVHHVDRDEDFGPESAYEAGRPNRKRAQPTLHDRQAREVAIQQKISLARQGLRNAGQAQHSLNTAALPAEVTRIQIQPDQSGRYRDQVNIDGRWYKIVSQDS